MADGITVESSGKSEGASPDKDFLELAHKRFKLAVDAENDFRLQALEHLKFAEGEQWPEEIQSARREDSRPCLVINKLPSSIRQVTNDQRQNRPSIKTRPVDDAADIETAKVRQGLFRHIENDSSADVAYDTAHDFQVRMGLGYIRVGSGFCDPMSFDQELKIMEVENPFSIYRDPFSKAADGSDMNYAFAVEDLSADEFKEQFPQAEPHSGEEFNSIGHNKSLWAPGDTIRVAEYFFKEFEEVEIVQLASGLVILASQLPQGTPPEAIKNKRTTRKVTIKWAKITGLQVLERGVWGGKKYIPIVPVYGEKRNIDGEVRLYGMVKDAMDPQRQYNYFASAETETIALAPKAPFIGAAGQFKGREAEWKEANLRSHPYLQYEPITIGGQAAPPPQRQVFEPAVQAVTFARGNAGEELKGATGVHDATLGNRSNETSGVAIQRRTAQAQTGNYHFNDNLTRSLKQVGRILDDAIPFYYDAARTIRILGETDEQEIVRINEQFEKNGEVKTHDLSKGKYDIVMETGPSYATKRQETAAHMLELAGKVPQLMNLAGDIVVKAMDLPNAGEISERLKKGLPPGIAENKDEKPLPPEVVQQLQQQSQMIEQLTQQYHSAQDELDQKTRELESKERIEMQKIQANIEIEMAKMGSKEAMALLAHEIAEIQGRLSLLNIDEPIAQESQNLEPAGPEGTAQPDLTGEESPGPSMEMP